MGEERRVKVPISVIEADAILYHLAGAAEGRLNVRAQEALRKRNMHPSEFASVRVSSFDEDCKSAAMILTPKKKAAPRLVACPKCAHAFTVDDDG